jgi:hypothetical protein
MVTQEVKRKLTAILSADRNRYTYHFMGDAQTGGQE